MTSSRLFFLKGGLPSTLDCLTIKLKYIKQIRSETELKPNHKRTIFSTNQVELSSGNNSKSNISLAQSRTSKIQNSLSHGIF